MNMHSNLASHLQPPLPSLNDPLVAHFTTLTGVPQRLPADAASNDVLQAMVMQLLRSNQVSVDVALHSGLMASKIQPQAAVSPVYHTAPVTFQAVPTTVNNAFSGVPLSELPSYSTSDAITQQLPLITALIELDRQNQQQQQRQIEDAVVVQALLQRQHQSHAVMPATTTGPLSQLSQLVASQPLVSAPAPRRQFVDSVSVPEQLTLLDYFVWRRSQ